MNTPPFPPVEQLTPHAGPMRLIHRILAASESEVFAEALIAPENPFFVPGRGVPGYVGFEIMAQAVSAQDGWSRRAREEAPQIGFLLGARKYRCAAAWFEPGERLVVTALAIVNEGELRAFDCRIEGRGDPHLATATMSVYRPDDPESFIRQSEHPAS